jgi:enamine deaminase RidA (YjgF/YER057c/UK114 family)
MLARRFPRLSSKPAFSFVAGGMAMEGSLVAMDAVAVATKVTPRNSKVAVLPKGPRVYISGQSAGGTLEEATKATLEKLKANLAFARLTLDDVVQVRSFVDPISSAGDVRKWIDAFFGANPPPQAFVEWTSKGRIEIELIAAAKPVKGKTAPLQHLWPPDEKPSPVFCRMTRVDSPVTIFLPGLYGKTRDDANAEIREIFAEMKEMLTGTKSDFLHLVKATYFVSTDEASKKLNEIRPEFYDPKHPPAASKAGVVSTGRVGRSVTLDMIAVPK